MKNKILLLLLVIFTISSYAQTPLAEVNIQLPVPVCHPGDCTALFADYYVGKTTEDYSVTSIPYAPSFAFSGGTILDSSSDDNWTPLINLPFTFSFYGVNYNQILVGSNGVITFDTTNQSPLGFCAWNFGGTIPNTTFPIRNAIYGVYQDTDIRGTANGGTVINPTIQNVNYYVLDVGVNAAPNRVFVANFNELPMYQCSTTVGLQTSQIVIHETTNIIEVFVKNRTACTVWNSGNGVIGLQNQSGTLATVPPGRNTGTWTTTNEAWRFSPNGASNTTLSWFNNNVLIAGATENPFTVCPTEGDHYSAAVTYNNGSSTNTITDALQDSIIAPQLPLNNPSDLSICGSSPVIDLTSNELIVLNGLNPNDFEFTYYENLTDAQNQASNFITTPTTYSFTSDRTIYMLITDFIGAGCAYIKPFQISLVTNVPAPIGASLQNFTAGQTLADLVVEGQNLNWYTTASGGFPLPLSTLLQDNVTYFVSQTINGCEGRMSIPNRLAVTVHLVLGNDTFAKSKFVVYPNPVSTLVSVSAANMIESIEVYNAVGQKILTQHPNQNEVKINAAQWTPGVYFIKVNDESQSIKMIKN